ncbi:GNAT family N-acetyltransferase [Cellulosimicrobium marinum]|uniref:GNAT family N-acetyltransferase n=1 Tax=Cellulosimicrobium marinum TaxID=1638992 RepID=UPI001E314322|nr:GNAT family N-acetyltransferase [Cellulosimicrobium marinum]MCB7135052.1 GNAT family N-acetyltransferase [Cellulosimicrobium marinum]
MNDLGPVGVRPARPDDAGAVWALVGDLATSYVPERAAFETSYPALLEDPSALAVVAEAVDGVVGYLVAHRHGTLYANAPVVWVGEVVVHASARRRGVGRALLAAAERWAGEVGAAYVSLASRRAGDFYVAAGYEASATFFRRVLRPPQDPGTAR